MSEILLPDLTIPVYKELVVKSVLRINQVLLPSIVDYSENQPDELMIEVAAVAEEIRRLILICPEGHFTHPFNGTSERRRFFHAIDEVPGDDDPSVEASHLIYDDFEGVTIFRRATEHADIDPGETDDPNTALSIIERPTSTSFYWVKLPGEAFVDSYLNDPGASLTQLETIAACAQNADRNTLYAVPFYANAQSGSAEQIATYKAYLQAGVDAMSKILHERLFSID